MNAARSTSSPTARASAAFGDDARPRHVGADDGVLVGAEACRVRLVGEHREERLLVRDLAAEGVGHAREAIAVGLHEHARVVGACDEVVHQRTPIHQVDGLPEDDQPAVHDLQIARVGDQRRHATGREPVGEDLELAPCRHAPEVGDHDAWRPGGAAPVAVARDQRLEHRVHHRIRLRTSKCSRKRSMIGNCSKTAASVSV